MSYYANITEAYPRIIEDVLRRGMPSAPRGMAIKEVIGYQFSLESYDHPFILQKSRAINYKFCILEGLCLIAGEYPPRVILHFNKRLENYMNQDTGTWDGVYATRVKKSLTNVYEELKRDPDSRRAVVPIFSAEDTERFGNSKDIPCTCYLQFLIRDGKLHMIANMRSNDLLWGLGNDVTQFGLLGKALASWLGIKTGTYTHHAGSMHSYDEREHQLRKILEAEFDKSEDYAELFSPSFAWSVESKENTEEQMWLLMKKLGNFVVTGDEDVFMAELKQPWKTYYDYLIGKTQITFTNSYAAAKDGK